MPLKKVPGWLVSAAVATEEEIQAVRKRRGFWIQRARKRKGYTLEALAAAMGYRSISGVSRWESGGRAVPGDKFEPLARYLSLPPGFLVNPPLTDDERLDEAVRAAEELEREDSDEEQPPALRAVAALAAAPRRRSA